MSIGYKIFPEEQFTYVKGTGLVSAKEIMLIGAEIFSNPLWKNGFNMLGDYREVSNFDAKTHEIYEVVAQDKIFNPHFDKSKFAVVASKDIVFGISRMWQLLSIDNILASQIFKTLPEALNWLEVDAAFFEKISSDFSVEPI